MFRRALIIAFIVVAAAPAFAATVVIRTGAFSGAWTTSGSGGSAQYATWTQGSGTTFSAATIAAAVCSFDGTAASGTVYLMSALGSTSANQVATPVTFSGITTSCATAASSPSTVFTGVTLPAGTYYLVVSDTTANFAIAFSSSAAETLATGVTTGNDAAAASASAAAAGWTTLGPAKGIIFSVTGTAGAPPTPTGVPTLGAIGMIGAVTLLAFSGLLFLKRETVNPLR